MVLTCGFGKTLISLWVTKEIKSKKIVIGVPNKLLLEQWSTEVLKVFPEISILLVKGGINVEDIKKFVRENEMCVVITTYSSSWKVAKAKCSFDMKINDEVHHLTTMNRTEETKKYIRMLDIHSKKQISLTATLKVLGNERDDETDKSVSNDNKIHFGEIIERKNLLYGIRSNILCDYSVQTILTDEEKLGEHLVKFRITDEKEKKLFLSAYVALKSINENHSHHLLIYCNSRPNSEKIMRFISLLLENKYFELPEIYYSEYHSEQRTKKQQNILDNFGKSKYGILSCVYCLGEGWNFPLLDGVVFAENMTSNIRIVQSALRSSRKNKKEPTKIAKIILPMLNSDDWLEEGKEDFKKIREIIYHMGLEDETITEKIKVIKTTIEKHPKKTEKEDMSEYIGEYDNDLTQNLKLKTIRRSSLNISYEKARKIITEKNIKTKKEYHELCKKDWRLVDDPEIVYKSRFTGWINYLGIKREYYELETCKEKVKEYLNKEKYNHLDLLGVCDELCKKDEKFPPYDLWMEYYNVKDLKEIINVITKKKKMGIV